MSEKKTLKEFIDSFNLPPSDRDMFLHPSWEMLLYEFGISADWGLLDNEPEFLVGDHIDELSWVCTDTLVGVSVYLFTDTRKPAFITYQWARKDDTFGEWYNEEAYNRCRDLVMDAIFKNRPESVSFINPNQDMSPVIQRKQSC